MDINTLIDHLNSIRDQVGGETKVLMFCDDNYSDPFEDDVEWNEPTDVVVVEDEDSDDSPKVFIKFNGC